MFQLRTPPRRHVVGWHEWHRRKAFQRELAWLLVWLPLLVIAMVLAARLGVGAAGCSFTGILPT